MWPFDYAVNYDVDGRLTEVLLFERAKDLRLVDGIQVVRLVDVDLPLELRCKVIDHLWVLPLTFIDLRDVRRNLWLLEIVLLLLFHALVIKGVLLTIFPINGEVGKFLIRKRLCLLLLLLIA